MKLTSDYNEKIPLFNVFLTPTGHLLLHSEKYGTMAIQKQL